MCVKLPKKLSVTRMHSSIDAYRLLQWPPLDVSQYLGVGVGQTLPEGRPPPPVDRMTDRRIWKHYFSLGSVTTNLLFTFWIKLSHRKGSSHHINVFLLRSFFLRVVSTSFWVDFRVQSQNAIDEKSNSSLLIDNATLKCTILNL